MPERAVAIDAPGELEPELVLLPDLAGIRLPAVGDRLAVALAGGARDRLAKAQPLTVLGFVGVGVVALGGEAHRQHVVGEEGGLVPGRGERDVQADLGLVGERLDPAEAVRVGPHRVVDPGEVDVELAAPLEQEVRQEERHLVHRQRKLERPVELVPLVGVLLRQVDRPRHELVPGVGIGAALGGDGAEQGVEQKERPRHLPAALVAGGGAPPGVGREARAGRGDDLGHLPQGRFRDPGLGGGELEGVPGVLLRQLRLERSRKSPGACGWSSARYSCQFHQRRTNSRS